MKRTLTTSSLLLVLVLALGFLGLAPSNTLTKDQEISGILSNVSPTNIFNTAQAMQNFRTRQSCSDQPEPGHGVTAARDYLFAQYSAIPGLQVRLTPSCMPVVRTRRRIT